MTSDFQFFMVNPIEKWSTHKLIDLFYSCKQVKQRNSINIYLKIYTNIKITSYAHAYNKWVSAYYLLSLVSELKSELVIFSGTWKIVNDINCILFLKLQLK